MGYGKTLPVSEPEMEDEKDLARDKRVEDVHIETAEDGTPKLIQITSLTRTDVDNVNFMRRTWLTDLRPFQRKMNPTLGLTTFKHALQLVSDEVDPNPWRKADVHPPAAFPQRPALVRTQLLVLDHDHCTLCYRECSARPLAHKKTLTIVVAQYPRVLIGPPNGWKRDNVGFIQAGKPRRPGLVHRR